ncbi:MAG: hypothetical protein NXI24_05940 [bacterium]|nr:hypothetical protein [bacterium]
MEFLNRILSRPTLLFLGAAPFLIFKLGYYLTGTPVTGWDTIGHARLAAVYSTFFADFASAGYDAGWFFGYPAFYFYPPAFYFFTNHLSLLPGVSVPLGFHLGILGTVLFFAWNFLRLLHIFLPPLLRSDPWPGTACSYFGLAMYFSYQGDGLQGVALVGVINGTVVATFAHALALMFFYHLELYRRRGDAPGRLQLARCVLILALLFLTHYLTTVFCYLLALLYLAVNYRSFTLRSGVALLALPPLLAFPIPYNYLTYGYLMNGQATIQHYPAVLSLLGSDFYQALVANQGRYLSTLIGEVLLGFKWLNLALIAGYLLLIRRSWLRRRKLPHIIFLILGSGLLLWLSQDASPSYIVHFVGIHWYRVFDLFYGLFVIGGVLGLAAAASRLRRNDLWRGRILMSAIAAVAIGRFLIWDPVAHEKYRSLEFYASGPDSTAFEEFLAGLEPGSVILPEKIRDRHLYGSPHSFDYFIQKYGHRNALGLTVESALTPSVSYAWISSAMPQIFQWGIDPSWNRQLYQNSSPGEIATALPAYLRRAGVNYILGRTPQAFAYLRQHFPLAFAANKQNPAAGVFAFRVPDSRAVFRAGGAQPIGYLNLDRLRGADDGPPARSQRRSMTRDFLLYSNQLRLRSLLRDAPPIINLDPHYRRGLKPDSDFQAISKNLSALILMHSGRDLMPSTMSHSLAQKLDLPIILVNFQKTAPDPGPTRYLYTNLQVPDAPRRSARLDQVSAAIADSPGTALKPEEFSHREIRLAVPESDFDRMPVEILLSHFPDWRIARAHDDDSGAGRTISTADMGEAGQKIFQTDGNRMLVFAAPGETLRMRFHPSFARTITCLLYLISCGLFAIGIYRFVFRVFYSRA